MDETVLRKELAPIIDEYRLLETRLIENIAASLKYDDDTGGSFEWYSNKLMELGGLNNKNTALVSEISGKTPKQVEDAFNSIGYGAVLEDDKIYNTAHDKGLLPSKPSSTYLSHGLKEIFQTQIALAEDKLNLTNTNAIESSKQAFLNAVNGCYIDVSSGAYDYNAALRRALTRLADNGITGATYYRKDGSRINYPLDAAVRRNIMTSSTKLTVEMQFERASEWGSDLIEVSAHMGARPLCAPYQGQIYSLSGTHPTYRAFSETSYGEAAGLFGINCGHVCYPYFEGLSGRTYRPYNEEDNQKAYKNSQKQRKLEVAVRKYKNRMLSAQASGHKEMFNETALELKKAERRLKAFMAETGRGQQPRTSVVGFSHSEAMKAVWAERKILTDTERYVINKYISSDSYKINEKLRNNEHLTNQDNEFIISLDSALNKLPKYKGEVVRALNISEENLDAFIIAHHRNKKVHYCAYSSFSTHDSYSDSANVKLYVKSNSGRDLRSFNPDESEVLYWRNSRFEVLNSIYLDGIYHIFLKEGD